MSSNYSGNPTATQAPSPQPAQGITPIAQLPSDGDSLNAASVAQAFKMLTDLGAYLTKNAAILPGDNAFTGTNNFSNEIVSESGATEATLRTTVSPVSGHRKLIGNFPVGISGTLTAINMYSQGDAQFDIVVNAVWDNTALTWSLINSGYVATKFTVGIDAITISQEAVTSNFL